MKKSWAIIFMHSGKTRLSACTNGIEGLSFMKKQRLLVLICILLSVLSLAACRNVGKEDASGANGSNTTAAAVASDQLDTVKPDAIKSWAAIYEKDKEVLSFNKDGSATYRSVAYDEYSIDDNFITFKGKEELKSRYLMKRKKMLLYETKEYVRDNSLDAYKDVPKDSITGFWSFGDYSFEFTDKGTFYEDRNFPGYYYVDEEEHSIKLMYNDHFEDIYLYYELSGDVLKIEYPWSLVPTEEK